MIKVCKQLFFLTINATEIIEIDEVEEEEISKQEYSGIPGSDGQIYVYLASDNEVNIMDS